MIVIGTHRANYYRLNAWPLTFYDARNPDQQKMNRCRNGNIGIKRLPYIQ